MDGRGVKRELFVSFLKIGMFTFGGGYAMLSLIEHEVVERKRWIDAGEYPDLLALAQSSPGPVSLNTSVFVGYRTAGTGGAAAAMAGVVLPSFVIMLLVALFFSGIRDNDYVEAAFRGMRPAVTALIAVPVIRLAGRLHPAMMAAAAAVAVAVAWFGVSPVHIIIGAALSGIAWELTMAKRAGR
ncbi:MAG: chromate transporter [Alistipes sp.]|nr:chromate transporter [Alistipes sp.]